MRSSLDLVANTFCEMLVVLVALFLLMTGIVITQARSSLEASQEVTQKAEQQISGLQASVDELTAQITATKPDNLGLIDFGGSPVDPLVTPVMIHLTDSELKRVVSMSLAEPSEFDGKSLYCPVQIDEEYQNVPDIRLSWAKFEAGVYGLPEGSVRQACLEDFCARFNDMLHANVNHAHRVLNLAELNGHASTGKFENFEVCRRPKLEFRVGEDAGCITCKDQESCNSLLSRKRAETVSDACYAIAVSREDAELKDVATRYFKPKGESAAQAESDGLRAALDKTSPQQLAPTDYQTVSMSIKYQSGKGRLPFDEFFSVVTLSKKPDETLVLNRQSTP